MDMQKVMILIKGEDRTGEVAEVRPKPMSHKVEVTYLGSKLYSYNEENVKILNDPKRLNLDGKVAYVDGIPLYNPKYILDFGSKFRVCRYNGVFDTVDARALLLVENGVCSKEGKQVLEYLTEISTYLSDDPKEEAFLQKEMSQLTFVHPKSALASYLSGNTGTRKRITDESIFPFRFNLSQKVALDESLSNSISIIEGPPGTGKTQTILNILANLIAIQGKNVAVVSNNNEAVKNVIEKMEKDGYGFLTALLGKNDNQTDFFNNLPMPEIKGWECKEDKRELNEEIKKLNFQLSIMMEQEREKVLLRQELENWTLEQQHFEVYFEQQNVDEIDKLPLLCKTPEKILSFLADTTVAMKYKTTEKLLYKLKMLIKYGIFNAKKLDQEEITLFLSLQKEFYKRQIAAVQKQIDHLEKQLEICSFDKLLQDHQKYSQKLFRKCLYESHGNLSHPYYTKRNFKVRFQDFIRRYPVILSTTHALRRSIPQNYLLDYVIIDESSQVDLITGVLALSCCKNVIIVGDEKQLPQIINETIKEKLQKVPPRKEYDYFEQNILSSFRTLFGKKIPTTTLREHYRCHPQIIEFCNRKYYSGKLIPYTDFDMSDSPLVLYKTSEGNHMRKVTWGNEKGTYNQRELDVIVEEVLKNPDYVDDKGHVGVVTPYRKQADKASTLLKDGIQSDTVHKYQGREKEIMIMSTVLDSSWQGQRGVDFVDDPHMINVAVSRAIKRFVLVTDNELFFKKGTNLIDLVRYIEYSTLDDNIIESEVVSIFDLLYQKYSAKLLPLKAKMDPKARWKSEEALRVLLEEIFMQEDYSSYCFTQQVLMRNLLKDTALLNETECRYVNNRASLDFVIFQKMDKSCVLVIEVDGFAFHENNPNQLMKDELKDTILKKYNIPILRLATNGSRERRSIENMLINLR